LQAAVSAKRVVEIDEPANVRPGIARGLVSLEVHLLVFDRLPEALDQNVVAPAPLAVHADSDLVRFQHIDEVRTCELAPLIGIDGVGFAVPRDRLLQGFDAEVGVHRVGESPGQDLSAVPVHHSHQEQESTAHRQIRLSRARAPHRSCDRQFRVPPRRTGRASFAMHPALQEPR